MHQRVLPQPEPLPSAAGLTLAGRISAIPMILQTLCDTTGLGFGAISHVTETSWTAMAVLDRIDFGLRAGEQLDVTTTFCREVASSRMPLIIEHASTDPVYSRHPTPLLYGIESYVAVPIIRRDGEIFGTICALDNKPASLSRSQLLPTLKLFAELVATQMEVEEQLDASRSALVDANEAGALREQFVAVLGHDLRNPIGAVIGGLELLSRRPLDERSMMLVGQMTQSCGRMSDLVGNVLDFARGRLGGGIPVERRMTPDLGPTLRHIVDELRVAHPGRTLDIDLVIDTPVFCDPQRIGQLLSNLLANALAHGSPDGPVQVTAKSVANRFQLSVRNEGDPVAPETMKNFFKPFQRAGLGLPSAGLGLGLGLYIAAEIARSHGGTLDAACAARTTSFTLEIPAS